MAAPMVDEFTIMQGDQYMIPFSITDKNDKVLTDEVIRDVEIIVGSIRKTTPDVRYNDELKVWEFPLLQDESFQISQRSVNIQVRVQIQSGDIMGVDLGLVPISQSISKEVL